MKRVLTTRENLLIQLTAPEDLLGAHTQDPAVIVVDTQARSPQRWGKEAGPKHQ